MKIVLLTKKCRYAEIVLEELRKNRIKIDAVIIERPRTLGIAEKALKLFRKHGMTELVLTVVRYLRAHLASRRNKWTKDEYYFTFTESVSVVNNFNGQECEKLLRSLEPSIVILAGTRILKPVIIKIPEVGTVNAHPGLLPKYRGVDVIPWAILNGDDIGVTLHFVDSGVDTGNIIKQQTIEILENDTIQELRKRAEIISAKLILEFILDCKQNKQGIVSRENIKELGKQYYKMEPGTLKAAEMRLSQMIAKKYH